MAFWKWSTRRDPGLISFSFDLHHLAGRKDAEAALQEAERAMQVLEEDTPGLLQRLQVSISSR